jgi:hypothetical protein
MQQTREQSMRLNEINQQLKYKERLSPFEKKVIPINRSSELDVEFYIVKKNSLDVSSEFFFNGLLSKPLETGDHFTVNGLFYEVIAITRNFTKTGDILKEVAPKVLIKEALPESNSESPDWEKSKNHETVTVPEKKLSATPEDLPKRKYYQRKFT